MVQYVILNLIYRESSFRNNFQFFQKELYLFVFLLEDKINDFATFIRDIYYGSYVLNITYLHPCKFTEWYRG